MRIRLFVLCVQVSQLKATAYTVQTVHLFYQSKTGQIRYECETPSRVLQLQINATILASDIKAI